MIDTIRLGIQTRLPSSQEMRQDGFTGKGGGFYKNATLPNGSVIKLQASNHYGHQHFSAEFSAPKLIYGSNVEMIKPNDLPFLLDTVSDIVSNETRIDFDANAAKIMALHLCYNWKLAEEFDAYAYLDEMKLTTYPHKRRAIHAKENGVDTVYWGNKGEEILIYLKHAETARLAKKGKVSSRFVAQSIGMLRLEHRLLKSEKCKALADRFGCSNRADSLLEHFSEMAQETLLEDMEILGLDKIIEVTGERERLNLLKDYCGDNNRKYQNLCALLHNADVFGIDNIVSLGLINPNTFRTRKAEIKKAGISFSKPTNGRILPPLPAPQFDENNLGVNDASLYHTAFNKTDICFTRSNSLIQMSSEFVN